MPLAGLARIGELPFVVAAGGIVGLIGVPDAARGDIADELLAIGALFGVEFAREIFADLRAVGGVINILAIGRKHEEI